MADDNRNIELYVKLLGAVFLLLGATWAGIGLWLSELVITFAGGLAGAAGIALLGVAPKMDSDAVNN